MGVSRTHDRVFDLKEAHTGRDFNFLIYKRRQMYRLVALHVSELVFSSSYFPETVLCFSMLSFSFTGFSSSQSLAPPTPKGAPAPFQFRQLTTVALGTALCWSCWCLLCPDPLLLVPFPVSLFTSFPWKSSHLFQGWAHYSPSLWCHHWWIPFLISWPTRLFHTSLHLHLLLSNFFPTTWLKVTIFQNSAQMPLPLCSLHDLGSYIPSGIITSELWSYADNTIVVHIILCCKYLWIFTSPPLDWVLQEGTPCILYTQGLK